VQGVEVHRVLGKRRIWLPHDLCSAGRAYAVEFPESEWPNSALSSETANPNDRKIRRRSMKDMARYRTRIFWSSDDEGYIAECPDLPGCSAFAETQEQALAELSHARKAWLSAARAAGNPIPPPSNPPQASGKILVRMPKSLHARLVSTAEMESISLNQYIVYLLTRNDIEPAHRRMSRSSSRFVINHKESATPPAALKRTTSQGGVSHMKSRRKSATASAKS
jgi:predicted RNase H-like HicB family nuclease